MSHLNTNNNFISYKDLPVIKLNSFDYFFKSKNYNDRIYFKKIENSKACTVEWVLENEEERNLIFKELKSIISKEISLPVKNYNDFN